MTPKQNLTTKVMEKRLIPFPSRSLNDDTNILTETDTETFFRYQIFSNRDQNFFSETKFSETKTDTFFSRPNSLKPIPKPSKNWQKSRDQNQNRDFFPKPNSPKPKPKPLQNWQKSRNREVSKPKCQPLLLNLFNNL